MTPQRLNDELGDVASLADALPIISDDCDRSKRATCAVTSEISGRLDGLYPEVQDTLDDPARFLGKRVRK